MCFAAMAGASLGLNTVSAFLGQRAENEALDINASLERSNALFAEKQAQDAINRGRLRVSGIHTERDQVIGQQRGALASSGVSVSSGSAVDVAIDTRRSAAQDADIEMRNANRESRGFLAKARDARYQASMYDAQQMNPLLPAAATLFNDGARIGGIFERSELTGNYQQSSLEQQSYFAKRNLAQSRLFGLGG